MTDRSAPTAAPTDHTRSFHLRVFGCQMNFYDGELIRAGFLRRGYAEAATPEPTYGTSASSSKP